jgi:lysophospholipase L1-like esterase
MKTGRGVLVCSLVLNLALVALGTSFVYQRGDILYLVSRSTTTAPLLKNFEKPRYLGRKNLYASLPRKDAAVVFAGDSLIAQCPWDELLERPVLGRGIGSDTIEGLRLRIGEVLEHHPRQLFIMIGINDLLAGKTGDDVWMDYRKLISVIRTDSPQTQLFLQSILPVNGAVWQDELPRNIATHIVRVNEQLKETGDGQHIVYLDLYSHMVGEVDQLNKGYTEDGVHLNGAGYFKWRDLLRPYLSPGNS